jgi:hypothetical protein
MKRVLNQNLLTSTNTLSIVALSEETVDTTNWECKTGLGRSAVVNELANAK